MFNRHNIFFIFLFIGGLSVYFSLSFFSSGQEAQEHKVVLTAEGFIPGKLSVQKGDTIIFTTALDKPFWPASDLHPTHGIYPEFDPRKPIDPGQSWSFKFTKKGTWKYHDHLFSTYRGVIVVENDKNKSVAYSAGDCSNAENKPKCWEDILDRALDKKGLNSAFELIADLYDSYPQFAPDCHSYSHKIGIAAYEKFAKGQEVELSPRTYYCGYGFYHGFMETMFQREGEATRAQEFCAYAGKKLADQTSDAEGACYHGIGHGTVDGGDPQAWGDPQKMIEPGLKLCEQISKKREHLYRCVTGIYNAIEILSTDPKYNLTMMIQDPFWLCPSQPDKYKEGCYTNMLPALFRFTGYDFEKMMKIIEKLPSAGDKEALDLLEHTVKGMVTLSLFFDYIMYNLQEPDYNAAKGVALCHSLKPDLRLPCVEGLAGGHMKFGKPEQEYIQGLSFCGSEMLKDDEKDICYKYILVRLRLWYPLDKARMICQEVPEKYRKFCALR